jgi:pyruvate/2-oxoglutarate dehydrogenase complex dihydrolipoamide acyltransferase (E2) component
MCVAVEGEAVEGSTPDESPVGDSANVAPAQDYNATRSNKPTSVRDGGGDCDDTDERCTPGDAGPADAVCDTIDDDCDGDSIDDGQRAQDYNSSRSNKPNTAANPVDHLDDDDDDGLSTELNARAAASGQLFGAYLSADGSAGTDALKKGDRLSTSADENDSDEQPEFNRFSDIQGNVQVDQETGKRELSSVAVAAQDLRDWNNEDREAFSRLQAAVASNTPEHASLRITQQVLNNDKIEKLEVTQTEARINYRAEMRLFGFIPVEREVEGRAQADGTVEIDYPWYRFLSTTPDRAEIENQLQTSIEIMMTLTADPI